MMANAVLVYHVQTVSNQQQTFKFLSQTLYFNYNFITAYPEPEALISTTTTETPTTTLRPTGEGKKSLNKN